MAIISSIQIHLMLLFISSSSAFLRSRSLFKYISCYCLSTNENFCDKISVNSNTSHVIVYHASPQSKRRGGMIQIHLMLLFISVQAGEVRAGPAFKYISCYCLSMFWEYVQGKRKIFKYISCYCLSQKFYVFPVCHFDSNTSHVIVYRLSAMRESGSKAIQIHLMLLFIRSRNHQYIK